MNRRLASIDVGSHTARLLIAEAQRRSLGPMLARDREYINLAHYLSGDTPRLLSPEAAQVVGRCLVNFQERISMLEGRLVLAAGTGLIREAVNREEFIGDLFEISGIRIQPISPQREAVLSAKGALSWVKRAPEKPSLVFDLGGATTEFCLVSGEEFVVRSLPLGASLLTRRFLANDPPSGLEQEALNGEIRRILSQGLKDLYLGEHIEWLIGTGGTCVSLAALSLGIGVGELAPEVINGRELHKEAVRLLAERLSSLKALERAQLKGLDEGRAPVIVAGTWIVCQIMDYLGVDKIIVSMHDLLEGMLLEFLEGEEDGG